MKYNVAVLTPSTSNKSETFIANHINHIPHNITTVYGGRIPFTTSNTKPSVITKIISRLTDPSGWPQSYYRKELKSLLNKKKIDLVFAEYLVVGANVAQVCKELNIPLIVTALGYDISMYHVMEEYETAYKRLFTYCDAVIIVSKTMRPKLEALGCDPDKIIYSPAAPDESFFKLRPTLQSQHVFALGRFVNKKAPHLSLLAFKEVIKEFPEASFTFAGDGPLMNVVKDLVFALGLENHIQLPGYITQDEQKELLTNSRVFIQHSKTALDGDQEGTPVAILEASAAGVPVVSTYHSGIPEVIKHSETGFLVDEGDYMSMAKFIKTLLGDIQLSLSMGKDGKLFVKEHFTLNKHIEIINNAITDALTH